MQFSMSKREKNKTISDSNTQRSHIHYLTSRRDDYHINEWKKSISINMGLFKKELCEMSIIWEAQVRIQTQHWRRSDNWGTVRITTCQLEEGNLHFSLFHLFAAAIFAVDGDRISFCKNVWANSPPGDFTPPRLRSLWHSCSLACNWFQLQFIKYGLCGAMRSAAPSIWRPPQGA